MTSYISYNINYISHSYKYLSLDRYYYFILTSFLPCSPLFQYRYD